MIVFAAKVSVRKIVVGVLAVGLVLVGAAALLPKTAEADTAVSAEGAALSAKLKTNEDSSTTLSSRRRDWISRRIRASALRCTPTR